MNQDQSNEAPEDEAKALLMQPQYDVIFKHFGFTADNAKRQVNVYFDTLGFELHKKKMMLRTRDKGGRTELTFKQPHGTGRLETNHKPLGSDEHTALLVYQMVPKGKVRDALEKLGMSQLSFDRLGELTTKRIAIEYEGCELALDYNTYLNVMDWEIEMEKKDPAADEKAVLIGLLAKLGIPYVPAKSKVERFMEVYTEPELVHRADRA